MSLVNLNGKLVPAAEARVSLFDHGLLYGDGLFETVRVHEGRLFQLGAHLDRLEESAARLALPLPWSREDLAEAVRGAVRANGVRHGAARLTVTRGEGSPVPDPSVCPEPAYFVTVRETAPPDEAAFERGISACVAGLHPRWIVPGVKSLCFLPFQQARQEARRRGCDEGLLTCEGTVVEASTSNLFVVTDGHLATPPLESGCLPGITRALVLELASSLDIPARERPISTGSLARCDELFLTSSAVGVVPVVRIEDTLIGGGRPGPITRRLRRACEEKLRGCTE